MKSTLPLSSLMSFLAIAAALTAAPARGQEGELERLVVRVAPRELVGRESDEMPAELPIDEGGRRFDPATLEVVRWDPDARRAISEPLRLRWYDNAIAYDFPECEQNVHATDGVHLTFVNRPRWGDFYNLLGDGAGGRLVWTHRQDRDQPSWYAISFRRLPEGRLPQEVAPRGFVGDGSHRAAAIGSSTTGAIHSRVAVADFNGDGLPDLLVGTARGHVLAYHNVGTAAQPRFTMARLLSTADGRPLDVGWSAAPLVVDWDQDGAADLLVGAERNRILYFHNASGNHAPRWVNQGFLLAEGEPIALPIEPVPKSPPGVYPLDYYPVLDAVDWNGDGQTDLLAGGYITGRIYLYKNLGRDANGLPRLASAGHLFADGRPLNVGDWAAAPCAADFDGDGDLDLVSGNMPLTTGGGDATSAEHFLRYYENLGSRTEGRLVERPFPCSGTFPASALGTPRAADMNADGLLDLVVSAGENIYLYLNEGRRNGSDGTAPRFAVHAEAMPGVWSSAPLPTFGVQFIDTDGDGRDDMLSGLTIYRQQGRDDYRGEPLLAPGNHIDHAVARGDGWTFTQLADLDGDGRLDLLFGTHEGNIWLHRNVSSKRGGRPPRFDETGDKLLVTDGKPIKVGPTPEASVEFDVLQGARTAFTAADFDADGLVDLVVGDTYGKVRYFHNEGDRAAARFAPALEIGDLKIRMVPSAADWDGDGRMDVIGSAAGGDVVTFRNLGPNAFAAAEPIGVPAVPYSPFASVTDFNGDGDADLMVGTAYGYSCFFERSFLEHGYARAEWVP